MLCSRSVFDRFSVSKLKTIRFTGQRESVFQATSDSLTLQSQYCTFEDTSSWASCQSKKEPRRQRLLKSTCSSKKLYNTMRPSNSLLSWFLEVWRPNCAASWPWGTRNQHGLTRAFHDSMWVRKTVTVLYLATWLNSNIAQKHGMELCWSRSFEWPTLIVSLCHRGLPKKCIQIQDSWLMATMRSWQ